MLDQSSRLLTLTTPLGPNELVLKSIVGEERISGLYSYRLRMLSDNNQIPENVMLGKRVTVSLPLGDGSPRFFDGHLCSFVGGDEDKNGRREYTAELVPWLWFLTRSSDCRIFQNKTVPEIVLEVFQQLGFSDFDMSQVAENHERREYCVQYGETDFQFVSRLLEEEGIFYFFEHQSESHILKLADQTTAYRKCVEHEVNMPRDVGSQSISSQLMSWEREHRFRTGRWSQSDYNYKTPGNRLLTTQNTVYPHPDFKNFEFYEHPGQFGNLVDGDQQSRLRMEAEETEHHLVCATSNCRSFTPGGLFQVGQHHSASEGDRDYLIVSVKHDIREPLMYETGDADEHDYRNELTCIPADITYRPRRDTQKPRIHGPQTAVVVGPEQQEIHTDELGRVKVQFHWDRQGENDERSSCWVRVSQMWAGNRWGMHYWPRVGHEVVVAFLHGDPDRPLIIGSVYNAHNMPPYDLPAGQTRSGVISRSTPEGGPENFNELRFEDRKGEEEVYLHAEKDFVLVVENDEIRDVKHDRNTHVCNNDNIKAKNISLTGENSINLTVGASSITLTPAAIHIKSPTIISEADANHVTLGSTVVSKAKATNAMYGAVNLSSANAVNSIEGGFVKINS